MSRLSLNLILIALVWLPLGCAPAVQEVVHPDDALMAAIQAEDCMALWPLMTEDIQFYSRKASSSATIIARIKACSSNGLCVSTIGSWRRISITTPT